MTNNIKCQAKNPSACIDPMCPEKRGQAAQLAAATNFNEYEAAKEKQEKNPNSNKLVGWYKKITGSIKVTEFENNPKNNSSSENLTPLGESTNALAKGTSALAKGTSALAKDTESLVDTLHKVNGAIIELMESVKYADSVYKTNAEKRANAVKKANAARKRSFMEEAKEAEAKKVETKSTLITNSKKSSVTAEELKQIKEREAYLTRATNHQNQTRTSTEDIKKLAEGDIQKVTSTNSSTSKADMEKMTKE